MLRIHFLQHWFNLADLACEEALYDSASLRRFAGIDLGNEPVPDATTMLKFRQLCWSSTNSLSSCLRKSAAYCKAAA
jgi:IS5 family transposase